MLPPLTGIAVKDTDVPAQIEVELADIDTEGVTELVVIVTVLLVAVGVVVQAALDVMITRITSPLFNAEEEKELLLFPIFTPFTCHW